MAQRGFGRLLAQLRGELIECGSAAMSVAQRQMGAGKSQAQRQIGAAKAWAGSQQTQVAVAHDPHPWGVHWPGHVRDPACRVDTTEIKKAFLRWSSFSIVDDEIAAQVAQTSTASVLDLPDAQLTDAGRMHKRMFAVMNSRAGR